MKNNGSALRGGLMVRLGCGLLALIMLLGLLFAGGVFAYADNTEDNTPKLSAVDTKNGFYVEVKGASVPADTATLVLKPVSDTVLTYATNGRTLSEDEFFLMYDLCFEDIYTHEEIEVDSDFYHVTVYFTAPGECFGSIAVTPVGGTLGEMETKAKNKLDAEAAEAEKAVEEAAEETAEEPAATEETVADSALAETDTAVDTVDTAEADADVAPAEEAAVEDVPAVAALTEDAAPVAADADENNTDNAPAEENTSADVNVADTEEAAEPAEGENAPAEEEKTDRNLTESPADVRDIYNGNSYVTFNTDGLGILKFTGTTYNVNDLPAVTETEESTASATLYDRLMACETLDEIYSIMENATEEELAEMDAFTEEQNAALTEKMDALGAYGVDTLEDYSTEIAIGNTYKVIKDSEQSRTLTVEDSGGNAVSGFTLKERTGNTNGYTISVDNSVPDETYTATVTWMVNWLGTTRECKDTIIFTVISNPVKASVFFLSSPTGDPSDNKTSTWGSEIITATINKRDATYEELDGYGAKNCFTPASYILNMPEGMEKQSDGSYSLPKEKYSNAWTTIYNTYKTTWGKENDMTLDEDKVEGIYLKPYKLSQNNNVSSGYTYPDHIDCTVSVKIKGQYLARFWVTKPGAEAPALVDSKTYSKGASIEKTTKAPTDDSGNYPQTITVAGKKYVFDGWYNEKNQKIAENSWPYVPNDDELTDGAVDFYARYIPEAYDLTIKKTLSGNMYNANDTFEFTVKYGDTTENFTLGNNGEHKISVPVGAEVTVTENPGSYSYRFVSIDPISVTKTDVENGIKFTMPEQDVTVTINNDYTVTLDTGVSLDSLPYILILGVVAVGAVVIVVNRRKHRRDY